MLAQARLLDITCCKEGEGRRLIPCLAAPAKLISFSTYIEGISWLADATNKPCAEHILSLLIIERERVKARKCGHAYFGQKCCANFGHFILLFISHMIQAREAALSLLEEDFGSRLMMAAF